MYRTRLRELSLALCQTLGEHGASNVDGCGALAAVLVSSMVDAGMAKEKALETFAGTWDVIAREYEALKHGAPPHYEDYQFVYSPDTEDAVERDPNLKEMMRGLHAQLRQALEGLATGRFATEDEAMASIGAIRIDLDDDDGGPVGHA